MLFSPIIPLAPSNNLNGFTSYVSKNGNGQILIHPHNASISKLISSPQTSLALQGIRIVPLTTNNLQQSNLSSSKPQPIVAKIIDSSGATSIPAKTPKAVPTQINISTTSSSNQTNLAKSIINCKPFTVSTKSNNI